MPPKGACTTTCPAGYYPEDSNLECTPCHQGSSNPHSCKTCDGPADNACLSCNSNTFLFPSTQGQCVNPCPDGYYGDYSVLKCLPCYTSSTSPFTCKTCIAASNFSCITCGPGQYLFPVTPSGQCIDNCPPGYYKDDLTNRCLKCFENSADNPYSCKTCIGPSSNQCTACLSGTFLSGGECTIPCPPGSWPDTSTNICANCYYNTVGPLFSCVTCTTGASNNCLSCNSGNFLHPTPIGECIASCPDGYWGDASTNTCQMCYQNTANLALSCLTCDGGTSSSCLSCGPEAFLSGGKCLEVCSPTQWNDPMTGVCQECWQSAIGPAYSCLTCLGGGPSQCSSCGSGTFLYPALLGECLGACPAGYYGNTTTNTCELCEQDHSNLTFSCVTCDGGTLNDCLSCKDGAYLHPAAGGACLPSCPTGFWADNSANICQQCYQSASEPFTCAACNGPYFNHCLACNAPGFLDPLTDSCVSVCPTGYWGDTSNRICLTCYSTEDPYAVHGTCRSCYGPNDNQCTSCFSGRFYLNTSDTCVLNCPDGWFPNMTNNSCDPCFATSSFQSTSRTCATCVGPNYYECLSCLPDSWLYQNQCLSVCPDGTYPNNDTLTCDPCYQSTSITDTSQSCKTCSGPLDTNCLTCYAGSYLYPPQMSCLTSCPKTSWYPRTDTNECDKCYTAPNLKPLTPQSCLTCSGSAATNCNSCSPNTFLWPGNNTCMTACPNNLTYYSDIYSWTCVSCSTLSVQQSYINSCAANNPTGKTGSAFSFGGTVASLMTSVVTAGANPGSAFLSNYVSVVTIYIYINVQFPTNFVNWVLSLQVNDFMPNPFAKLRDEDTIITAANGKYAFWLTPTVFLENSGFNMAKNLFILFIIAILSLLTALSNPRSKLYSRLKYLRDSVRWNVFLSSYLGDFAPFTIFALLHLIQNNNPGPYADFSLFLAILVLISYAGLLMLFIFQLNRKKTKTYSSIDQQATKVVPIGKTTNEHLQKKKSPQKTEEDDWVEVSKSIDMISEGFKSHHWVARNYIVIQMLQDLQTILSIALLQFSGLTQALFYTLISLQAVVINLKYRPMKSKVVAVLVVFNEVIKTMMGGLAVYLGSERYLPKGISEKMKERIGKTLIYTLIITAGLNVFIGIWLSLSEMYEGIKQCRERRRKKKQPSEATDQTRNSTSMATLHNPIPTDVSQNLADNIKLAKQMSSSSKLDLDDSMQKTTMSLSTSIKLNEDDLLPKTNVSLKEFEESLKEYKSYQKDIDYKFKFTKKPNPQFDYPKVVLGKK